MAAIKTTEKMKAARKAAMARLRAMSFEELLENSVANLGTTTVEFLTACKHARPVRVTVEKTVMREEFTVSAATFTKEQYLGGSKFAAAAAICTQAWSSVADSRQDAYYLAAAA